jgi:hypothetical protein
LLRWLPCFFFRWRLDKRRNHNALRTSEPPLCAAKRDGPAASALKIPPADLTTLAARNKGQFPSLRVMQAIKAGPSVPAHGSEIMPVWGPIFLRGDNADTAAQAPPQTPAGVAEEGEQQGRHGPTAAEVQLRIYNLTEYVRTLQLK